MKNLKRHKLITTFGKEETVKERKMKSVQVDKKTWIMVDTDIPDQEARDRFFLNQEANHRKFETRKDYFKW